jgi:hypothetical protein
MELARRWCAVSRKPERRDTNAADGPERGPGRTVEVKFLVDAGSWFAVHLRPSLVVFDNILVGRKWEKTKAEPPQNVAAECWR